MLATILTLILIVISTLIAYGFASRNPSHIKTIFVFFIEFIAVFIFCPLSIYFTDTLTNYVSSFAHLEVSSTETYDLTAVKNNYDDTFTYIYTDSIVVKTKTIAAADCAIAYSNTPQVEVYTYTYENPILRFLLFNPNIHSYTLYIPEDAEVSPYYEINLY